MSVHYLVRLGGSFSGPRYDGLKDKIFEVQVRTILTDAWANVSHHLAYKAEASVPSELKRDFHALSGLFYVADSQFQALAIGSEQMAAHSAERITTGLFDLEISLESLQAFLRQTFPTREQAVRSDISDFAGELTRFGYRRLADVAEAVESGSADAEARDRELAEADGVDSYFIDLGMARSAVGATNEDYRGFLFGVSERPTDEEA